MLSNGHIFVVKSNENTETKQIPTSKRLFLNSFKKILIIISHGHENKMCTIHQKPGKTLCSLSNTLTRTGM